MISVTTRTLLPIRRDKQIGVTASISSSVSPGTGVGSGGSVSSHPGLSLLDYASAGHTGFAPSDSPVFTTQITSPLIYGSSVANGDITIEGTSSATKTTSYILMQQSGGSVGIGVVPDGSRSLAVGNGIGITGNTTIASGNCLFFGSATVSDSGSRIKIFQYDGDGYLDFYENLYFRSGAASSSNKIIFTTAGSVSTVGGIHIGGTSDPGIDNLIVDGISIFGDDLGTTSFSEGFAGSGWKLDKEDDYSLTVDNLTVRKMMRVYELEINKISSVNGGIVVSAANGKVYSIGNIFNSWSNVSFSEFESDGLDVSKCVNISGGAIANTITGWAFAGEVITITYTAVINSGTAPSFVIRENDSSVVTTQIVAGTHSINRTVGSTANFYIRIYANTLAACDIELSDVSITSDSRLIFDEDTSAAGTGNIIQFQEDDFIRAQEWTGHGVDAYEGQVSYVHHSATLGQAFIISDSTDTPWEGMELVQVGNETDTDRQSVIYITASDTNNPYIDMLAEVDDGSLADHQKLRIGNLTGITDADLGGALGGYGLFADNVYLKGKVVASTGYIGGTSGWVIAAGKITSTGIGIATTTGDATYAFWAGDNTPANAEFSVKHTGALKAVGAIELGTATATVDTIDQGIAIIGPDIYENAYNGDGSGVKINRIGHGGTEDHFRDFAVYDGKGVKLIQIAGSTPSFTFGSGVASTNVTVTLYGTLNLDNIPSSNSGLSAGDVYRDGSGADATLKIK